MKRGSSGLCGILALDKPAAITSHDVVDCVRRVTAERRVGHAGTLDPAATGLMLVGVGAATRLCSYLTGHDKTYRARIAFGVSTDTDDAEGRIISSGIGRSTVVADIDPVAVLDALIGEHLQLPPAYSAIKKNGVVAYRAAREGKSIELEPRPCRIDCADLIDTGLLAADLDDGEGGRFSQELPYWDVDLRVSKGTYIRSIARDLGHRLSCGAYLAALRRKAIEDFDIDAATSLDDFMHLPEGELPKLWCDPTVLLGFPVMRLDEHQVLAVTNGRDLENTQGYARGTLVSCVRGECLLAIYEAVQDTLRPSTVIPGGVCGVR